MILSSSPLPELSSPAQRFAELLPPDKQWYTVREAALILGRSEQYVRDCFLRGKLLGHSANGRSDRIQEQRRRVQIRREGLVLYLAESANYDFGLLLERVKALLRCLPETERTAALRYLRELEERPRLPTTRRSRA